MTEVIEHFSNRGILSLGLGLFWNFYYVFRRRLPPYGSVPIDARS
jgi:hypothetical protein